jgi:peptidoglycan-associated lipoprotein
MNNTTRLAATLMACLAMAACTKKVKEQPVVVDQGQPSTGAQTAPVGDNVPGRYTAADLDTDACLRQRVVYFDFDQDTLRPEFQNIVACHAKYLRDQPQSRMNLEGNADERGTREYNLGLGERRGNAVSAAIQGNGGSGEQISVISYGEERPTCADSSESCWQRNRRVEIVYTTK